MLDIHLAPFVIYRLELEPGAPAAFQEQLAKYKALAIQRTAHITDTAEKGATLATLVYGERDATLRAALAPLLQPGVLEAGDVLWPDNQNSAPTQ